MKRTISFLLFVLCLLSFTLPLAAETEDRSYLGQLLNEVYNPDLYTKDSYKAYQKAVNNALAVYENDDATPESVSDALTNLMVARQELIIIPNRYDLLDYASEIDQYLYGIRYDLKPETETILKEAKDEFLTLYENELLTEDQLTAAKQSFDKIVELAKASKEIKKFSPEDAEENIIVPKKVISGNQSLGKVSEIRLTILGIGIGFFLIGTVAAILYLKPPKFLQ